MQVLILCGGKGTRAYPYTEHIPKPMMPICGQPILAHVMNIYASQGHKEFILSLGYRKEGIIDYFDGRFPDWKIDFVDTGEDSDTAERIELCRDILRDTFFVNYSDGVGNVDLGKLLAFHNSHNGVATLTSVPLPSQYGTLEMSGDNQITQFREKPVIRDYLINAGFFVFDKQVFDLWSGKNLEKDVLPYLGSIKQLYGYVHEGFWKSMDTYKDHQELERMFRDDKYICSVDREEPREAAAANYGK